MNASMTQRKFDPTERRVGVRRTVWILAALAVAVFVGFVLNVVLR